MISNFNLLFLSTVKKTDLNYYWIMLNKVYQFLYLLNYEYPGFHSWFQNKVIPELATRKKEIIIIERNKIIAGVSIIKNTCEEKKICTIRIGKNFRNQGLGKKLIEISLMELSSNKPIITVSSLRYMQFKRIFDYFGFKMEDIAASYYKGSMDEMCFNGHLSGKKYDPDIEPINKLLYVSDNTIKTYNN